MKVSPIPLILAAVLAAGPLQARGARAGDDDGGGEVELLEGAARPASGVPAPAELPEPRTLPPAGTVAGAEAVRLVSQALDRIAALQILVAADGAAVDRERALAELEEARRALQAALVEVGRLREDTDLRAWLRAEGLLGVEPAASDEPAADPPEPTLAGLPPDRFATLVAAIRGVSFTEGKMQVLTRELADGRVTSEQAAALVELFSFSRDRVDALVFLHPRVVDPENFEGLLSALKFESDRQTVRSTLGLEG